ncbi:MAG: hypothetical protein GY745_15285 [Actinomycetia bacterium]|nr:hypothetical protein [Actinomycetes bacterium]MCP3912094.1 hypothetical protein [Actinomycetes bacterium]MCP4086397.1 hypothetical protein [Actinomycetes bacterium]
MPDFANLSEAELARLLDYFGVEWLYEPHTFVLESGPHGQVVEAFNPDFFLPETGEYLELTTLDQKLVTKKNRKVRRLKELYPELPVRLVYRRQYLDLMRRFGLEAPSSLEHEQPLVPATTVPGLANPDSVSEDDDQALAAAG